MLTELSIRDIALFPRLRLQLGPGLNVFSGETGAGKSLVLGSLRLLCGERAPAGVVRRGAERGIVEGIFRLDPGGWIAERLRELGIDLEDDELIVRREIPASGKGRVRVNGAAVPLSTLAKASELLIDLHGQHDHQSLLYPSFQLDAVDAYADSFGSRRAFAGLLAEWKECSQELEEAEAASREDRERQDLTRFQLRELEEAAPEPGEHDRLRVEKSRLERAEFLRSSAQRIVDILAEADHCVRDTAADLDQLATEAAEHDPAWLDVVENLRSIGITATETALDVRRLGEQAVDDPERLMLVVERVRLLADLLHKYGPGEDELFVLWERLREEEADPEARSRRIEALRKRQGLIFDRLLDAGNALTQKRKTVASKLRRAVEGVLDELGMEGTRFEARVTARTTGTIVCEERALRAGVTGLDVVEFFLAPNRGEKMDKLSAIASGGEISRVMLALKSVLGSNRGTATMLFDEIDMGVGGRVAAKIASVLAALAEERQVICITHLAAIASRARLHLKVEKREEDGRTVSQVEPISEDRRVEEIARMLGGESGEGVAMDHARELLKGGTS